MPKPSRPPRKSAPPKESFPSIEPETMTGVLRMHPRGFGFVIPDQPAKTPQDVFIPKHLTDNAIDGDRVEVAINPDSNSQKGPEGKILAVLKRGRTHLAGIIRQVDTSGTPLAHVPLLGSSRPVVIRLNSSQTVKIGDRVILKVLNWGDQNNPPEAELTHIIGHISDPSCDIIAALEEFDIHSNFSKLALKEAKDIGTEVDPKDLKKRKNLTDVVSFTIDPQDARDYDDALSLSIDEKGIYHLAVHIADVAHYVKRNSALDQEAHLRCNSVYFPATCIPMLPEALSNNLCSLREGVIRLTVTVLMDFDKEGTLLKKKVVRSYIKSSKRFTYEEAKEIIDGKAKSEHAEALKNMVDLCLLLKKKRYERGSMDFSLPELLIKVDSKGEPTGTRIVEYDISHQLVEEFMLKANETVAKELFDRGKPLLYRIHEEPTEEHMQDFLALARGLGFAVPVKPTQSEIQELLTKAKNSPYGPQLTVGFIRSMKLAFYSEDNVGHYGLALEYYCHFTSPIRRYTDLIIQRLLFDEEGEEIDLKKIALKCSEQERIAFRAEMHVKLLKKLRLLQKFLKEDPLKEYKATITRIKPFGLFFEMADLALEGFLHISELENDYFFYNAEKNHLVGKGSGRIHALGEPLKVRVKSIDLILLESKWELVTKNPRAGAPRKRRK